MILSALASELDAETISKQAQAYASVLPAFNFESEQVTQMARTIVEDLERSGRLKEYDRIHRINTAARRAPTIDGLFKLYQALLDAKVIPKTT